MDRSAMWRRAAERDRPFDLVVVGGGATGVGIAVDAASRGYAVALFEQDDFGKGTSTRSTKLIHGGFRYLKQGNVRLVVDALRERGILRRNAPHLVRPQAFVVPTYATWETWFYGAGLWLYDTLAGRLGFGRSQILARDDVLRALPTLDADGLRSGVRYFDGQFDDARLLIALARTAAREGAVVVNHAPVTALRTEPSGDVAGVEVEDRETGERLAIAARCVVNAAGPFADDVRRLADAAAEPMIAPSQGIHLVFDRSFLPGEAALMVPRTEDRRVLFAIPWHGATLVGTTDTPIEHALLEPRALPEEVDFVLRTTARYLARDPTESDVRCVFAGIRPLVRRRGVARTASLARDHTLHVSAGRLVTITGGKWTTYRRMAEDSVDRAARIAGLEARPCRTRELALHGACAPSDGTFAAYGSDRPALLALVDRDPELGRPLHPRTTDCGAQVVFAARHEMARTVEDVLARRTRLLFVDACAAVEAAPAVAAILARELGRDTRWERDQVAAFDRLAAGYRLT